MRLRHTILFSLMGLAVLAVAQQSDIFIQITRQERATIALPDFRGSGQAQDFMGAFNSTLFSELETSGLFRIVPKTMYPLQVPQQPDDFREPLPPPTPPARGAQPQPIRRGPWLTDWSEPPVNANYLAIGYQADDGRQEALLLRVDKDAIRAMLVSLEARTGLRVTYMDEEARKAGKG
ncbi:MAG: hypothetical protein K6T61_13320 [Bryobacteraceae bacterium]|nr:hypothetical protein [Bryobacteraceae bacterium]